MITFVIFLLMLIPFVASAATCRGVTTTATVTCGGSPWNFDDTNADVVIGSSCVDVVEIDACDNYCAQGGADSITVKSTACSGGLGKAYIDAGAGDDNIGCQDDCDVIGGTGEDWLWVNGADVNFDGGDHNDRMIISNPPVANLNFDGGSGTDTVDCGGFDEVNDFFTITTTSVENWLHTTCPGGCCN